MECWDPEGKIGWSRDPETGEHFMVNIETGEGLDRHAAIRARQFEKAAQDFTKTVERADGTIDLEQTKTGREIGGIFRKLAKRYRDVCE